MTRHTGETINITGRGPVVVNHPAALAVTHDGQALVLCPNSQQVGAHLHFHGATGDGGHRVSHCLVDAPGGYFIDEGRELTDDEWDRLSKAHTAVAEAQGDLLDVFYELAEKEQT